MPAKRTTSKSRKARVRSPSVRARRPARTDTDPGAGPSADPRQRLGAAALKLLAKKPWNELQLTSVARTAGVPRGELLTLCPSKVELVSLILTELARKADARYMPEAGADAHDRLFDVAMSWFEALAPDKRALAALHAGLKRDPVTVLAARSGFAAVARWLMTLADADQGPWVSARSLAFALVLFRVLPVWLDDDADLSRTMARLDSDLRRADSFFERFAPR